METWSAVNAQLYLEEGIGAEAPILWPPDAKH